MYGAAWRTPKRKYGATEYNDSQFGYNEVGSCGHAPLAHVPTHVRDHEVHRLANQETNWTSRELIVFLALFAVMLLVLALLVGGLYTAVKAPL